MENTEKIIEWSLKYAEELSLKAEFYTGFENIYPDVYDIGIYIKINNSEYYGRGTDKVEKVAYCKALSEAIERASLKVYEIQNTNGLSVHYDLDAAKKIAHNEILERDAFFCHFLLNRGFLEMHSLKKNQSVAKIIEKGIEIKFYEMCRYKGGIGVLCVADGKNFTKPFGKILGTAFGNDCDEVMGKSFLEVIRSFVHFEKDKEIIPISESDFENLREINFSHHGKLALDSNYSKKIDRWINYNPILIKQEPCSSDFRYKVFDLKKLSIPNIPLLLVKAENDSAQGIYAGRTSSEDINLSRLANISGTTVGLSDINFMIHPFD